MPEIVARLGAWLLDLQHALLTLGACCLLVGLIGIAVGRRRTGGYY